MASAPRRAWAVIALLFFAEVHSMQIHTRVDANAEAQAHVSGMFQGVTESPHNNLVVVGAVGACLLSALVVGDHRVKANMALSTAPKEYKNVMMGFDDSLDLLAGMAMVAIWVSIIVYEGAKMYNDKHGLYSHRFGTPLVNGTSGQLEDNAVMEPFSTTSNLAYVAVGISLILRPTRVDGVARPRTLEADALLVILVLLGIGSSMYHSTGSEQGEDPYNEDDTSVALSRLYHMMDNVGMVIIMPTIALALLHGYVQQAQSKYGLITRTSKVNSLIFFMMVPVVSVSLLSCDIYRTNDLLLYYTLVIIVVAVLITARKITQGHAQPAKVVGYMVVVLLSLYLFFAGLIANQGMGTLLGIMLANGKHPEIPLKYWPSGTVPTQPSETTSGRTDYYFQPSDSNTSTSPGGDFFKWTAFENLGTKEERIRNRHIHDLSHGMWHYFSALVLGLLSLLAVQAQDTGVQMDRTNTITVINLVITATAFVYVTRLTPDKQEKGMLTVMGLSFIIQTLHFARALPKYLTNDHARHEESIMVGFHPLTLADRLVVFLVLILILMPCALGYTGDGVPFFLKPCNPALDHYDGCGLGLRAHHSMKRNATRDTLHIGLNQELYA